MMNRGPSRRWMMAFVMIPVLGACAVDGLDDQLGPTIEDTAYAPVLDIDLANFTETASGLWFSDIVMGDGPTAFPGDSVNVNVQGWLPNGTQFQPSADLEFRLASGAVIPGFDEGVTGMKAGGLRKIIVPGELAYGTRGNPAAGIPPNQVIVFEIDMLEIFDEQ